MKKFSNFKFKDKVRKVNESDDYSAMQIDSQPNSKPEENKTQSATGGTDVAKFISKLLESREVAQVYHWTVKGDMGSHAAHLALEAYYNGVIEFIDELVEVYQGQYGLIEEYDVIDTKETKSKDKLDYYKEVVDFVRESRKCIVVEDTHLHNIVDEIVALLYKTIYKLTYNK